MATSLYGSIIFGPVHSRRLGLSLGVNLLLPTAKLCSFDCVYCECGWNSEHPHGAFNSKEDVCRELTEALHRMEAAGQLPDVITFAGNGEPTLHPDFPWIIERTRAIRDEICPECRIAVLTNSTMTHRPQVAAALETVDQNIVKFDSAVYGTYLAMNRPCNPVSIEEQIARLRAFRGKCIVQTMFISGGAVCNTTEEEIEAWVKAVAEIRPSEVMLYSLDRDTPCTDLRRADEDTMRRIASRIEELGIPTLVKA